MKMVRSMLLRGLSLSTAALLFACSGTQGTDSGADRGTGNPSETPPQTPREVAESIPTPPQDVPATVAQERKAFLIKDGLDRARRSLEYRLYQDALREAATVLEIDPSNEDARNILVAASEILGDETARVARTFDSSNER